MWIDGNLMIDFDNVSVRQATATDGFAGVWLTSYYGGGGQSTHPDQYVLYDNIIVSRSYIGPMGGGGDTPSPPSDGSGGGDASASGGSGCGFVKEDGKGQGAKEEGLSFMLLTIMLTIIYLIRRGKAMPRPIKSLLFISFMNLIIVLIFALPAMAVEPICPGGSSPDSNVLMCDDFEDGTWLDNWTASAGYSPEYSEAVKCDSNIFGYQDKCAAYSGILHFDNEWGYDNHFGSRGLGGEYNELYLRMYIYFSSPYSWGNVSDKGIYFRSYEGNNAEVIPNIKIEYSRDGVGKPNLESPAFLTGQHNKPQNHGNDIIFQNGKWYLVEFYVKLNTPGVSDGIAKVWIDDASNTINSQTLRIYYNNLLIRNSSRGYNRLMLTLYNQRCDLGSACPSTNPQWMKWDNIVVSKAPIGPMGGSTGGDTLPPSSGSGSDSGGVSSSGSGCGFVREDNKGQGAKGEGLTFALIISLTVIFVLRKITRKIKAISMIMKVFILALFMAVLLLPGVSMAANYYIDYQSGSDANSGTSKSSPWQRAPGMAGFSGVYTHQTGDKFLFKGGATWPSAAFPLTIGYSGDAAASDEYTVDKTWYAGSNWTRPVFDGENLTQKFIAASNKHYIIIDNIGFTRSDTDYTDSYGNMPYPLYLTSISHWDIKNNYFHDLNAQYSGTSYDNGGYAIYIQASGGFISIHDNRAERVYMHRFAVVGPSSDFSTFEFYNNTVSDVAVGLVFGGNNGYTFDNILIHDNDFSKPYMPYADHSLDGSLTQLNGAIDASQTIINVANGAVFTSGYNFVIQIGSEYIYVPAGGKTGNTLSNVTRGYAGSAAQAHANLDSVGLTCSDPWHGDYIHIYQIGSGSITNVKIYNNYFHPGYSGPMPPYPCNSSTWDGGMTAYLYLENHLASPLIYNNIFVGDDEGISMQFSLRNTTNPLVMNNTFIGSNKKIGLGIADSSNNAVVKNNIFSNVKYGITVSADSLSGFTSDNNNFYGLNAVGQLGALQCTGNSTFCSSLSDWQNVLGGCPNAGNDCGSSTDNPLLDGNYKLTSSSPLTVRDAGAALSSYFSADKDGVSRPQGAAWDIGAYEYCASGNCAGGGGGTGGNTGGDSSASGGSGCGFVKDDGKGQEAKGEEVALMILLVIILKIISVTFRLFERRRAS